MKTIACEWLTFDVAREVLWVRFLHARIAEALEIHDLGDELQSLLADGPPRLVLDFSAVEFMSSAAFGKLISLNAKVKARDGAVVFCNIRPELLQVFHTCHLDRIFNIVQDAADVRARFI